MITVYKIHDTRFTFEVSRFTYSNSPQFVLCALFWPECVSGVIIYCTDIQFHNRLRKTICCRPAATQVRGSAQGKKAMPSHPSGTVTFLFTDIEGSTRHWEQQPQAMSNALLRHDAIMRNAIEANGGYIFKTIGDAFCAAFPTAPQALQAALDAQRALAAEQWPEMTGPVQARMALHTGSAEERGGDYFGPPVNRVARLLSAGHGGQTLLSEISSGLVRDVLSPGVTLRDMGEHRLKDLAQTEQIFQVLGPGLPSEFAPLKTLDNHPNNLPLQLTPFIGREKEVETVTERLLRPEVRLLTLTGPGGTGKTRLALQAAAELAEEFEQGVFFVDLAPITDPGLVGSEIAQALGVQEAPGRPISDTLKEHLRDRRMLLVLDNFEQVVQAAALVPQLMQAAPDIKFVATSRIRLQVRGEHEYSVSPLALPRRKPPPTIEQWTQYDAVCLFIERALALTPDFAITNSNAPAVAEICHRLDGLPLAIELAAARIKILTPQVMLTRLESRLKVLTGGQRDVPARQQTLRGAIDWSYDLLDEGEKQLFRRLAIFQGGRTLEAIEAICNAEGDLEIDVLDGVQSLVDKSLLRQEEGVGGEPRFVMLETIHEYARGKLEGGEAEAMQRAHAAYYLQLAEETAPLLSRPEATTWFNRLDEEHDNIRAALRWSLDNGEIEMALNLSSGGCTDTIRKGTTGPRKPLRRALKLHPKRGPER